MIEFDRVWKSFRLPNGKRKHVARGLTLTLPRERRVAVIGRNGEGKSTLLRMIAGTLRPDSGTIRRSGKVSWPMGFAGGFHSALTGRQNARFVARIYGADTDALVEEVEAFAELGPHFDARLDTYSSGLKARLAFGVSLAARFDCYLVDEITAVGDAAFKQKAKRAFQQRLGQVQLVMVSHNEPTLRDYCDCALLLRDGHAWFFDDLEDGLRAYAETEAA